MNEEEMEVLIAFLLWAIIPIGAGIVWWATCDRIMDLALTPTRKRLLLRYIMIKLGSVIFILGCILYGIYAIKHT